MNERFLRFQSADTELVGTLSLPQGHPCGAILIMHPFDEEKKFAHRVLTTASWQLAKAGFAALRFDLSGCGDSFGRFRDATIAQWLRDIVTAANLLRRETGCEKISLLGLRLGATLCWLGRNEVDDLDAIVLWEPILSGRKYVDILWRRKLIKEMITAGKGRTSFEAARAELEQTGFIDLDGWALGKTLLDELIELDISTPIQPVPPCPVRTLTVQIAFNAKVSGELNTFADAVRAADGSVDVAGIRERPIWDRIDIVPATELITTTINWLSQK
ncbi:MAG: alpha/beta hydrolase [Candidatus Cloacimonetes bacterium]|nr:alpha/beta hydrolase [Candidatus Cloacimonadota bacterium]